MKGIAGQIVIVGAGVLGRAIASQLLTKRVVTRDQLWAITKTESSAAAVRTALKIRAYASRYTAHLRRVRTVILAVKPHQARSVVADLTRQGLPPGCIVLSVVTGVSISELAEHLPPRTQVIRAITNTPLVVGEGMTSLAFGPNVSPKTKRFADLICSSFGSCTEIEESQCDAMTGLSASGPAYLYLIMEALADGGVRVGLSRKQSLQAVAQMVVGAARMIQKTGAHPASLRDDVTTPAGCTIAGLLVMEDGKLRSTLARAVEEATSTARMLGVRR